MMENGQAKNVKDGSERPWRVRANGLEVRLRLTPRGGRDEIDGIATLSDGSCVLKVRVRAAPQDGEANEAARKVIAKALKIAASSVMLEAGATSRVKVMMIIGDPVVLESAISAVADK